MSIHHEEFNPSHLHNRMTIQSTFNSPLLSLAGALEMASELRGQSPEALGSALCERLKTWSAMLPVALMGSSQQQLLMQSAILRNLSGSWAWHASPDSLTCIDRGRSGVQRFHLYGTASLGPCMRDPDFLVLPLRQSRPSDGGCGGLCVLMLKNDTIDVIRLHKGVRLEGFAGCCIRNVEFRGFEIPDDAWLTGPFDVQAMVEHTWLLQCAVALCAVQGLADQAAHVVAAFLQHRVLYGQPAIRLPQVRHSLTEIEMRLILSESFAHSGLALHSIATKDMYYAQACCWHARELLYAAIEQLGVLLGARSFVRSGIEGQYQLIQAMLHTTLLTFCAADKSRDGVLPRTQILSERVDLFAREQPLMLAKYGTPDKPAYTSVVSALREYCRHGTVPHGDVADLLVQGLLDRDNHVLRP